MSEKTKILVVDDEPIQLNMITLIFETEPQYDVFVATNAEDAMTLAEEHVPSLIISDYYMPFEDGFTFCQKIKSHPKLYDAMFILVSVASESQVKVKALSVGADDFISKPFEPEIILSKVRALLRIKSLQNILKKNNEELERLNEELSQGFLSVVNLLTQLIGLRVPNASLRAQQAVKLVKWMGGRLELDESVMKTAEIAALLHEIGKITIADEYLKKPESELPDAVKYNVSSFPVIGQLLVGNIPHLKEVGDIIRHQLENYDGTGYPDKLMHEQIHIASRMLRGINIIEECVSSQICSSDKIIPVIKKARGTLLDPRIVQLLEEYLMINDNTTCLQRKRVLTVYELQEGMILANDLCTGSGIKLLQKDSAISMSNIEKILSYNHFDPIINNIYIYDERD